MVLLVSIEYLQKVSVGFLHKGGKTKRVNMWWT